MGGQLAVQLDRHQLAAHRQPVEGGAQLLASGLPLTLSALRRSTPSSEPCSAIHFAAVFGPTPLHAGNVVDRVAGQGQVVDDALRAARRTWPARRTSSSRLVAHGVDQRPRSRVHELGQVFVAGRDNDHAVALPAAAMRHRVPITSSASTPGTVQNGPAEQACTTSWIGSICSRSSIRRHGCALGLVFGIPVVAEGLALGVEHADGMRGADLVALQLFSSWRPCHAPRRWAHRSGPRRSGMRMEGAVEITGSVDQQQYRFAHRTQIVAA